MAVHDDADPVWYPSLFDKFFVVLVIFEAFMIFCWTQFAQYAPNVAPNTVTGQSLPQVTISGNYVFWQNIHMFIFIGFSLLMMFMKRYGFMAAGMNFLIAMVVIQWAPMVNNLVYNIIIGNQNYNLVTVSILTLIEADYAAASVLIALGAYLGRTSPLQTLVIALIQVFCYAVNNQIGLIWFSAVDMGGAMYVHTFGAFFGLAVSRAILTKENRANTFYESSYRSDMFAFVGTAFLWLLWPSFNAALALGQTQMRAVVNTVFALCASGVTAFASSYMLRGIQKFSMEDIQRASLAGGVAIGSSQCMTLDIGAAIAVGVVAGFVSTFGHYYVKDTLASSIGLSDTMGVLSTHGIPGIIGGLCSFTVSSMLNQSYVDGVPIGLIYPARGAPLYRSAFDQGRYQLRTLVMSVFIALITGTLTGLLMRLEFFNPPKAAAYLDNTDFIVPADFRADKIELLVNHLNQGGDCALLNPGTGKAKSFSQDLEASYTAGNRFFDTSKATAAQTRLQPGSPVLGYNLSGVGHEM